VGLNPPLLRFNEDSWGRIGVEKGGVGGDQEKRGEEVES